ncbi:tRNA-methyltransferase, partial [Haematococcus lacustris]
MGRGGRGGGRRGRGGGRGGRGGKPNLFVEDKSNADFEEYYKAQGIVPEEEWDAFLACLRSPLPVTFRINGSGPFADHLREKFEKDFLSYFSSDVVTVDGEPVQAPRPLPWYPNNYAWHMYFSRNQLRKVPILEALHEFMKKANDNGSISRQEAVSMVPPLFLDVHPHHKVLDMCAAPGSKTFQLLEAVHGSTGAPAPAPLPLLPTGFVVANDADYQRCQLLTHQLKRMCSPCLLVANHSAEFFPFVKSGPNQQQVSVTRAPTKAVGGQQPAGHDPLRFDRILCDVPCSGDGTMRKAPDIWRRWSVTSGNGLHIMQLRIAMHGCRMLQVGGLLVYSTCTFNPIEDEAVVSELLLRCGPALELCDMSHALPALRRLPGRTSWQVRDKGGWYASWEEAVAAGARLEPSLFPSPAKASLPLQRCMRFLPHHQDTGGFFVAVLRLVAEL